MKYQSKLEIIVLIKTSLLHLALFCCISWRDDDDDHKLISFLIVRYVFIFILQADELPPEQIAGK